MCILHLGGLACGKPATDDSDSPGHLPVRTVCRFVPRADRAVTVRVGTDRMWTDRVGQTAWGRIAELGLQAGMAFVVGLRRGQRLAPPVEFDYIGPQQQLLLRGKRGSILWPRAIQNQIIPVESQRGMLKLFPGSVQQVRQSRFVLCVQRLAGRHRCHLPHLGCGNPAEKRLPDQFCHCRRRSPQPLVIRRARNEH
jgi:hypothetical protein